MTTQQTKPLTAEVFLAATQQASDDYWDKVWAEDQPEDPADEPDTPENPDDTNYEFPDQEEQ